MNPIKSETEWIIRKILSDIKKLDSRLNKRTREKIYQIQKNILFFIIDAEYRIEGLKGSIESIKKFTKQFTSIERELKRDIPFDFFYSILYAINGDIKQFRDRINILKSFTDSIVWKFCTNTEIKFLSFNQKENPIIEKTGLLYELSAFEYLYKKHSKDKLIFILSDITNCVKISDILVIGEGGIRGLIE